MSELTALERLARILTSLQHQTPYLETLELPPGEHDTDSDLSGEIPYTLAHFRTHQFEDVDVYDHDGTMIGWGGEEVDPELLAEDLFTLMSALVYHLRHRKNPTS